jgi:hypothetical protein
MPLSIAPPVANSSSNSSAAAAHAGSSGSRNAKKGCKNKVQKLNDSLRTGDPTFDPTQVVTVAARGTGGRPVHIYVYHQEEVVHVLRLLIAGG